MAWYKTMQALDITLNRPTFTCLWNDQRVKSLLRGILMSSFRERLPVLYELKSAADAE